MGSDTTGFVYVTYIRSTADKVFAAITDPAVARRYWGHENVSDWRPGSRWEHVRDDAQRGVKVAGEVIECVPPERLVISWADPARIDEPGATSRVTFEVAPYDDMVRLKVTHDALEPGSGMDRGIRQGWPIVLSSLKSLLETGRGIDVFAKPSQAPATDARP